MEARMKRLVTIIGVCVALAGTLMCMGCDTRQESVTKSAVPSQPAAQGNANGATGNKKAVLSMPGP